MNDFWHKANCAFTDKEREEFNMWKVDMYLLSDKVKDALFFLNLHADANCLPDKKTVNRLAKKIRDLHRDLHAEICEIPSMSK